MKKVTKSLVAGLVGLLLTAGTVYAAYMVWSHFTQTNVKEPISVTWEKELPIDAYPNQTYSFGACLHNGWADGNGDQKVGVKVTHSDNLEAGILGSRDSKTIVWNTLNTFTLGNGVGDCVRGEVKTKSDMAPGSAWVNVDVTRE